MLLDPFLKSTWGISPRVQYASQQCVRQKKNARTLFVWVGQKTHRTWDFPLYLQSLNADCCSSRFQHYVEHARTDGKWLHPWKYFVVYKVRRLEVWKVIAICIANFFVLLRMLNVATGSSGTLKMSNEFAEFSACRAVCLFDFLGPRTKGARNLPKLQWPVGRFLGGFPLRCK